MSKKRIYLASSWRNTRQPEVLAALRDAGHEVYDFRNPSPDDKGFAWAAIDPEWKDWTVEKFREALKHPLAVKGHNYDHTALEWCNACVLLLPSGNSAHLEAGWCAGRSKPTFVFAPDIREPELMYKSFDFVQARLGYETFCLELPELLESLEKSVVYFDVSISSASIISNPKAVIAMNISYDNDK